MDIKKKYLEYVCVYRVKAGFKEISQIEEIEETESELRKKYANNGGIPAWLAEKLGISLIELGELESNDEIIKERKKIDSIFNRYSSKKSSSKNNDFLFQNFEEFYNWFLKNTKNGDTCCYCGVEEKDLKEYFNKDNEQYKNARQRGQVLEIERIVTAPKEKNVYSPENCSLACYICNNAKSDFISPKDFKPIASGINEFWENKLNKAVEFPEESKIWER